eukprot:6372462-Ditylum_brightwellii.AAC.1
MDTFETAESGTMTLDHLCRVRLYLGATTLADINNNSRKITLSWALTGYTRCRPTTQWPNQEMPSKYSWKIWRRYLWKFLQQKYQQTLGSTKTGPSTKIWVFGQYQVH